MQSADSIESKQDGSVSPPDQSEGAAGDNGEDGSGYDGDAAAARGGLQPSLF